MQGNPPSSATPLFGCYSREDRKSVQSTGPSLKTNPLTHPGWLVFSHSTLDAQPSQAPAGGVLDAPFPSVQAVIHNCAIRL